jgi:glucokinase
MSERLIGVDVGGTKIAVAALEGATLQRPQVEPTDTRGGAELVEQLVRAIGRAGEACAVGVAVPSVVDFESGRVRSSVNVPLQDIPLREVLRDRVGVPVYVDNDATCAALAEAYDDDGSLIARHLVMFTVGTGVGGGIVIHGRVYRGATGAAAELGHTIIGADLRRAPFARGEDFPQPGSLEALASGSALNELACEHGVQPGRVIDAARDGHAGAQAAIELLGRRLGIGIANAINTFDPDLVVVGGGVSSAGEMLLAPAREEARRFTLSGVGTSTEIRQARYGARAGVRGAALLAGHELLAERERERASATGVAAG